MAQWRAEQIQAGHEAGKWAVFRNGEQHTKGGGEQAAKSWAKFMQRTSKRT